MTKGETELFPTLSDVDLCAVTDIWDLLFGIFLDVPTNLPSLGGLTGVLIMRTGGRTPVVELIGVSFTFFIFGSEKVTRGFVIGFVSKFLCIFF